MPEQADTQTVDTETKTAAQIHSERVEAAEDAWLDEHIGGGESEAVHDPGDEDDTKNENPEPGDTAKAKENDTTASDGDTATDGPDEDLAKALSALRRDGTPQRTIDAMLKAEDGVNELKAWGLKRAKVHADLDRMLSEGKRTDTDPVESQKGKDDASDTAASPEPKTDNLTDLVERLRDEYGDGAAEAFADFGKRLQSEHSRQMQEFQKDNQITRAYMERVMLREARDEVSKEFPQLKDESAYRTVETKVRSLVKTGDYQNAEDAMRDAALILFGRDVIRESKPARDLSRRLKNAGSPTVKSHKAPAASLTPDQAEDAALDMIFAGKKPDEIRRELGR